jgi:hypothetical protein
MLVLTVLKVFFVSAFVPKKPRDEMLVPREIVPAPIYRLYHGIDALPRLCAYSDDDDAGTSCRDELSVALLLVPLPVSLSVVVDVLGADAHSTA